MGYRPEDQELEEPLNIILKGIDDGLPKLVRATTNRIDSRDWKESHIQELNDIAVQIMYLGQRLRKLRSENW